MTSRGAHLRHRVADNYAHLATTRGLGDLRTKPWLRASINVFADSVAGLGPVLGVGCGPRTVPAYLAERGVDVSGADLSPRMIYNARRLHPHCTFRVGSWTDLDPAESSLGGVLGWWSLFHLPRTVLPRVLSSFARALVPSGQLILATHVGDLELRRTTAYGGVLVTWTTYQWQPEQRTALVQQAGLDPVAEVRLPADVESGAGVVLTAQRAGPPARHFAQSVVINVAVQRSADWWTWTSGRVRVSRAGDEHLRWDHRWCRRTSPSRKVSRTGLPVTLVITQVAHPP